jgi:prevent-host-death family protein
MRYAEHTMRSIPQRELRNDVARVLRAVEAGETIEVTVDGRPVAKIIPIERRRTFVPWEQIERMLREAPLDPGFARDIEDAVGDTVDTL